MRSKGKSSPFSRSLVIAGFATAYTLVVLPFTVNFFRAIASVPSTEATLFAFIPLEKAHIFMLPLFLAALEFASIQLAVRFWALESLVERILVFGLFLMCQAFTVTSVYYDIRNGNLAEERNEAEKHHIERIGGKEDELKAIQAQLATKKSESFGERENQIERITRRIGNITAELASRRRDQTGMNQGIASLLIADTLSTRTLAGEINERRTLRRRRETEQNSLIQERARLEQDLARLEAGLDESVSRRTGEAAQLEAEEKRLVGEITQLREVNAYSPASAVEYIVSNLLTARSSFAALIALLFPVTIMGIGFVIQSKPYAANRPQSLNLEHELLAASAYSPEGQRTMARHLVAIVGTYVAGLRASKELSGAMTRFHLEDEMKRSMLDELLAVKEDILKSKLSGEASAFLSGEIDKLINQQLNEEGATPV